MVRKTRKHTKKSKKTNGIFTIPELRHSFEHMEEFVDKMIQSRETRDKMIKDIRKEWHNVFRKELPKVSAESFLDDRITHSQHSHRRHTIRRKGGAMPLAGAPAEAYMLRQGVQLAPGQIPVNGHLPISNSNQSTFGSFTDYVLKGFGIGIPEIAQSFDPVEGQSHWPKVPSNMGSNTVLKGGKRKTRRGGAVLQGALLSQFTNRPFGASDVPNIGNDLQRMAYGQTVGESPNLIQQSPTYLLGAISPKIINV